MSESIRESSPYTIDSMRRSGINQIIAIATYSESAIHGRTKANGIASTYIDSDILPFRSLPTARASFEVGPLTLISDRSSRMYETEVNTNTTP
jgi:hypothetical protein